MSFKCLLGLVICSFSFGAQAEDPPKDTSIQSQAKELFAQKKRDEALNVLFEAEDYETDKVYENLALRISERFFTDEAQQEFETGESQRLTRSADAETSYKKAAELEPENLQPKQSLLVYFIEKNKCGEAQKELDKIVAIFSKHPRIEYFKYLIARCSQSQVIPPTNTGSLDSIFIELAGLYHMLESKSYIQMGKQAQAQLDAGAKHPDLYYYLFLSQQELGQSYRETLKKFIQMCKSSGEKEKRTYKWDPYYCSNLSSAEEALQAIEDIQ